MLKNISKLTFVLALAWIVSGCAMNQPKYDYSAFRASKPRSIVILPPVNESPDVKATYSLFAQMTTPLAESGYYVFPVALVDETFKQNGLTVANDIHAVAPQKLKEIFGADAALYVTITQYGATYTVLDSAAIVTAKARLVDLKTGSMLWEGSASASNNEGGNSNSGGLVGLLVTAVVKQILNSTLDASHRVAGMTSNRLLSAERTNGILHGPYSEKFGMD